MIDLDELEKTIEHAVLWTVNEVPSDALVKLKEVFAELRAAREALELADSQTQYPPLHFGDCLECGVEYRCNTKTAHKPDCDWMLARTAIDKWKDVAK